MKVCSVIFILLMMTASCSPQTGSSWQLAGSLQPGKMSVIDKDFSALPFSAILPGAGLSVQYEDAVSIHRMSFSWLGGSLKTGSQPAYRLDQNYLTADYTWLYKLGTPGNAWTGGAGAALQALYGSRKYKDFINNNTSFDFAASLCLAGRLSYSFNNSLPGWSLSDQLSIPFVSWLIEPPYDNESASSSIGDKDNRRRIAGLSSFIRLKNTASLDRTLSTRTMLSLAYSWDYYRIHDVREVRQAVHRLELIYRLTL